MTYATDFKELQLHASPDFLQQNEKTDKMTDCEFYRLIHQYREDYLSTNDYYNRLKKHRQQFAVVYDIIKQIDRYLLLLQQRGEMQHIEKSVHSYLPTKIMELWEQDKSLKSLYRAIGKYCEIFAKDFNTIAVHIAEYRAMIVLYRIMNKSYNKFTPKIQDMPLAQPPGFSGKSQNPNTKKRTHIPQKIKTLLQQENSSKCPFCENQEVDHFQYHHIDENPENSKIENLIMICPNCHSKITKGDISRDRVVHKKKLLQTSTPDINLAKLFSSKDDFRKGLNILLSTNNSIYYHELKEHWNSYSLIERFPFLNEFLNINLAKSIDFGLLPIIADFSLNHLCHDRSDKYIYNQEHQYMHNHEEEGFNLPVFYP